MAYNITLIPGDGIGPEVTDATRRVLEKSGVIFNWEIQNAGASVLDKYGTPLPDHVLQSIRKNKVALKGPITTPSGTGFRSVNVAMRKELDLYACLRPCKLYPGAPSPFKDIDIIIVRENTEDVYAGIEFEEESPEAAKLINFIAETKGDKVKADSGFSIKMISRTASRRIVRFAFEYARTHKRRKVTAVHKANIMKFSDGLFLAVSREVAKEYPDIKYEDRIIDNMTMQLVKKPQQFDVVVAPNIYGDILSDLCAGLVGGLGVTPGANIGDGIAVFEPTHGSAPNHAGQNKANPMATILSSVMMLQYLGENKAAESLERALADVIAEGKDVTYDLKSNTAANLAASTSQVVDAIIEKLEKPENSY
jgi:isocitrate dehydrogenase (NAD+)